MLCEDGFEVWAKYAGVYYVGNESRAPYFHTQIVVTSQLDRVEHSSLRILRRNADERDIRQFLAESEMYRDKQDREIIDSIPQVSVAVNQEKIRRDEIMCQALKELMKDELAQQYAEGEASGEARGEARGVAIGEA